MEAGYSGTPLPKKLGIKPGSRFWCEGPADRPTVEVLTGGLAEVVTDKSKFDVAVLFVERECDLTSSLARLIPRLDQRGGIWVAWPKRISTRPTDLTDSLVREIGLSTGLVDNKVCAVDDVWSALRFVIRVVHRT